MFICHVLGTYSNVWTVSWFWNKLSTRGVPDVRCWSGWFHKKLNDKRPLFFIIHINSTTTMKRTPKIKVPTPLDLEIDALEAQYKLAADACNVWEDHVHENYNGYGTLGILNMHAYLNNIARGFGHCNDERNFQEHRSRDKEDRWWEEAQRGNVLSVKASAIRQQIRERQVLRGDYTKNTRKKT